MRGIKRRQKVTFTCIECGKERTINIESKPDDDMCIYCKKKKGLLKTPEGEKECLVCNEAKPYTEFSRRASSSDGFERECKACSKKRKKEWDKKNPDYKSPSREKIIFTCVECGKERTVNKESKPKDNICGFCKAMKTNKERYGYETNLMKIKDLELLDIKANKKTCSVCKKYLPIEEFYDHAGHADGKDTICGECSRKKAIENRKKFPEKIRESNRKYLEKNREKINEYRKKYYHKNKNRILKVRKEHYIENREEVKNRVEEYRKTEKGRLVKTASNSKRRAKCQETDITSSFLEELKNNTTYCELCGEEIAEYHLDHIIPLSIDGPHLQANVRYICKSCNITRPRDGRDVLFYKEINASYSKKMRDREFTHTINNPGGYHKTPYSNRIILTHQPHFYEVEKKLWEDINVRKYIYENRMKYIYKRPYELSDLEILRAFKISGKHYGFSHFSPYWIKAFIEEFNVDSIYDPCGGWGHRLLGAWNINYYYNDIDERTYQGVKNIYNDYKKTDKKEKLFFNEDASRFILDKEYDAVFTCPPYFNLEEYTNENTSSSVYNKYYDWLHVWWKQVVENCNPNKYFSFVINSELSKDMSVIVENEGYELVKIITLGKNKSHYTSGNNELLHIYNKRR